MDAPATPTEPLTGVLTGRPEIDLLDPNFHVGDPHPAYRWMRDNEPLYRDVNGIWCATTMELVRGVERRASDFVSSRGYRSVWFPHETSMISKDDPGHQQQRRIVSDLFTSRAVSALEDETRRLVRDALATTASSDHFDVVDTVAARIPAEITCLLLGLPLTHWRDVRSWSERLMRVDMLHRDPEQLSDASRAMHEVAMTVAPLVAERRGCPADDLLARWSNAAAAGCPMSSADINSELGLVIPGGAETTRTTLARSLIMFSERNDLWERLAADPASIPVAVEELLRWVTPLNNMFRTVVADCELAGHQLREGDRIALVYPSANRDDTVFDDPDGIDLARRPNAHVAFGFGPHLCLGAHVARLVLRVALEEMTARFTNLRPGAEPVYEANVFVKAVERFVLVADRR